MPSLYADVALPVPVHRTFTYLIPEEFRDRAQPGCRVLVPFGRLTHTGVIVALNDRTDVKGVKPIRDALDVVPTFPSDLLALTRWLAEYYVAPWGEALRAATPQGLAIESAKVVALNAEVAIDVDELKRLGKQQRKVLEALQKDSPLPLKTLRTKTGIATIASAVTSLETRGWVTVKDTLRRPTASVKRLPCVTFSEAGWKELEEVRGSGTVPRALRSLDRLFTVIARGAEPLALSTAAESSGVSQATIRKLAAAGRLLIEQRESIRDPFNIPAEPPAVFIPTPHQAKAIAALYKALDDRSFRTFLLYGITGSGKTLVYIEAIRRALQQNRTAIVLVPEIALTPQTVRRFRSHFGDLVAVMHSQLSVGERYDTWRRAREGRARIVIGPRSAVFAPLPDLGLVVVDEEHDSSYKQYDPSPRYQGRDTAIVRGKQANAVVLLGSATPSVESFWNANSGKYKLLELPDRIDTARLPAVELVDMTVERKKRYEELKRQVKEKGTEFPKRLSPMSISSRLKEEIDKRLEKKEGVILLQNRRGFAHVIECLECGYTEKCVNCDVTMTYHLRTDDLHCHYCGSRRPAATACPKCLSGELRKLSFGTQQVYEELANVFPTAKILRMDRDTTRRKGSHEVLLRKFGAGDADILLGTQMVSKGLDFPRVTLVGVIAAETQLMLPDFRSAERTFQMLTQVAGRAGRSALQGEVIIQTHQPDHYSLRHAVTHDFRSFYAEELKYRMELRYPPVSRIVLIEATGGKEDQVRRASETIAKKIRSQKGDGSCEILGPADPPIPRLRNQYRKHIVIKNDKKLDPSAEKLRKLIAPLLEDTSALRGPKTVRITIDVDPHGMM